MSPNGDAIAFGALEGGLLSSLESNPTTCRSGLPERPTCAFLEKFESLRTVTRQMLRRPSLRDVEGAARVRRSDLQRELPWLELLQ
jgi:hypothetical protein